LQVVEAVHERAVEIEDDGWLQEFPRPRNANLNLVVLAGSAGKTFAAHP
jgi:hypothetical protein